MEVKVSKECDRASLQGKTAAITGLRSKCVFDQLPPECAFTALPAALGTF
jgi:hypothetical protein